MYPYPDTFPFEIGLLGIGPQQYGQIETALHRIDHSLIIRESSLSCLADYLMQNVPDLVLLSLAETRENYQQLRNQFNAIHLYSPRTRIMVMVDQKSAEVALMALSAGAVAYAYQEYTPKDTATLVWNALHHHGYLDARVARLLLAGKRAQRSWHPEERAIVAAIVATPIGSSLPLLHDDQAGYHLASVIARLAANPLPFSAHDDTSAIQLGDPDSV